MKKSLLALAVLSAFAGAASAQSSVTLSGGIDAAIQRVNGGWNMSTGNSGRTNFTLSGREDLGGGMAAFFAMNYRFNQGTGQSTTTSTATSFWRQTWIGLSGGFGDVRLGRMLPVLQEFNGGFDPFGTETVGSTHSGGLNAGLAGNARLNNAIYYRSPSLGGLQVHANIAAADQNDVAGGAFTSTGERPIGLGAQYAAGPLKLVAAYDRNTRDQKTKGIYGSFALGATTLMAQYENGDVSATADQTVYSIGARVAMGAATLKAGYRNNSDAEQKKLGLGVDYNLSKRTVVYADMAKQSGDGYSTAAKKTQFDMGIWHKF
jgi:predicted porin